MIFQCEKLSTKGLRDGLFSWQWIKVPAGVIKHTSSHWFFVFTSLPVIDSVSLFAKIFHKSQKCLLTCRCYKKKRKL